MTACGDTEQPPTGPSGATEGTGASGGGATGGGGHSHGGGGSGGDTTGEGGSGGGPECVEAGDCGISDDCHVFSCENGICTESFAPVGKQTTAQAVGDCKKNVCDGSGGITVEDDDADPFDDQNDCTEDTCDAGTPSNAPLPASTACASSGGKLCDGDGACVECIVNGDCQTGVCSGDNTCAPAQCGDETKNGTETDTDCGGPVCGKCGTGKACLVDGDCISAVCDPAAKTCSAPACTDNVKNGAETDKDCGGPVCPDCQAGQSCASPNDCESLVCSGVPLTCQAPTCMDSTKNGAETDQDCGGPVCPDCVNGKLCATGADCTSGVCSGVPATCQVPSCTDTVKNGTETGVDCGGTCPACPDDQPCNVAADCQSGFCNPQKLCKTPTCTDNVKNGTETDIDCGGTCPANCADGQSCMTGADCQSTYCLGTPPTCQPDIHGCTAANTTNMTGQASVNISFGNFYYTPKCIKVSPGTQVTWSGSFASHPLQGGTVVNFVPTPDNSQIPLTSTGTTKTITFSSPGTFPYYCQFHITNMQGVVFVE